MTDSMYSFFRTVTEFVLFDDCYGRVIILILLQNIVMKWKNISSNRNIHAQEITLKLLGRSTALKFKS